jgi:hypothetical protein
MSRSPEAVSGGRDCESQNRESRKRNLTGSGFRRSSAFATTARQSRLPLQLSWEASSFPYRRDGKRCARPTIKVRCDGTSQPALETRSTLLRASLARYPIIRFNPLRAKATSCGRMFFAEGPDRTRCRSSRAFCRSTFSPERFWSGDRTRRRRRRRRGMGVGPVYRPLAHR